VIDWPWPLPWVAAPAAPSAAPQPASSPQAAAEPAARTSQCFAGPGRRVLRRRPDGWDLCAVLVVFRLIVSLPWDHFSII